jgi:hypothetical protein
MSKLLGSESVVALIRKTTFVVVTRIPDVLRPHIVRDLLFHKIHVISAGKLADVTLTTLESSHAIRVTII